MAEKATGFTTETIMRDLKASPSGSPLPLLSGEEMRKVKFEVLIFIKNSFS